MPQPMIRWAPPRAPEVGEKFLARELAAASERPPVPAERHWHAVSRRGEGWDPTDPKSAREEACRDRSPSTPSTGRALKGAGGTEVARLLRTPEPPPKQSFRVDKSLDRDQLRHVTAMDPGRVPTRYEIVSMEESAYVFDNDTSRFADVTADDWREQLNGPQATPTPPRSPAAASQEGGAKRTPRARRDINGLLKSHKLHAAADPLHLHALGQPEDSFRWPEELGGQALPPPKHEGHDELAARLKQTEVASSPGSQRHGRLVRDNGPKAGAVVMWQPLNNKLCRAKYRKAGGSSDWPKLARLKGFKVEPGKAGEPRGVGQASIELLLDGTVVENVDMVDLTAEQQPRWATRDAVVAAIKAKPVAHGWEDTATWVPGRGVHMTYTNLDLEAKKHAAAEAAGYVEPIGMEGAKEDAMWKAEMAARDWEGAVFDMQEEDWERLCMEEWQGGEDEVRKATEDVEKQAARLAEEEDARQRKEQERLAKLQAKEDGTNEFINWWDSHDDDLQRTRDLESLTKAGLIGRKKKNMKKDMKNMKKDMNEDMKKVYDVNPKGPELTPEQKKRKEMARQRVNDFKETKKKQEAIAIQALAEEEARKLAALEEFNTQQEMLQAKLRQKQAAKAEMKRLKRLAAEAAAAAGPEKRTDASDGGSYTKEEFENIYGGPEEWDAAECDNGGGGDGGERKAAERKAEELEKAAEPEPEPELEEVRVVVEPDPELAPEPDPEPAPTPESTLRVQRLRREQSIEAERPGAHSGTADKNTPPADASLVMRRTLRVCHAC